MVQTVVKLRGTVTPDGRLEIAQHLDFVPGPVDVTVRAVADAPKESLSVILARIRAEQKARGYQPRSREEVDAGIRAMRDEADERFERTERLQEELRRAQEVTPC